MPRPDGHGGTIMAHEVTISDPISHCSFRWMEPWVAPGKPTATVTCMPRTLHYINQNIWADSIVTEPKKKYEPDADYLSEPLGNRSAICKPKASEIPRQSPIRGPARQISSSRRSGTRQI